jgi:hypothetical protein
MLLVQAWYETIFSGPLEIGLDREKVHQLEDEAFLYLQIEATEYDQEQTEM